MRGRNVRVKATTLAVVMAGAAASATGAQAQGFEGGRNAYGMPGLIDMPSATSFDDADLSISYSRFQVESRTALSFQITPRLTGSFRYSYIGAGLTYDRSFALQYRFLDEGRYTPALAIGLNDMVGTSLYAGEYLVATKTVGPSLRFSAGIGWGRLGSYNGFTNPLGAISGAFETRPPRSAGRGGEFEVNQWFRGDAAFFGGVEWQATDRLRLVAEYSSDAYTRTAGQTFDRATPFNFGLSWQATPRWTLDARYMYGSEIGFQATFALNPKERPHFGNNYDPAPPPVRVRGQEALAVLDVPLETALARDLRAQGILLNGVQLEGTAATVDIVNATYALDAQAVGRTARVMSRLLPDTVDRFTVILSRGGMSVSQIVLNRATLETQEFALDGTAAALSSAAIGDRTQGLPAVDDRYPNGGFALLPYVRPSYFDPDNPVRADAGVAVTGSAEVMPGLRLSGRVERKIVGNLDESTRRSDSVLPRVRSEANLYDREGETAITELTAAWYLRPAPELFARVTVGYLERMFAGASTEVLWKPEGTPFALGAEVNYVRQRDFNQLFGLRDYDVVTGHVSGYLELPNDFHLQLDAGRYLAGDYGATLSLDREFANGWRVGAFATLTDVPFSDFGEGSFDKGIRLDIPMDWIGNRSSRTKNSLVLRPIVRDGGARLDVAGRLYEEVRGASDRGLTEGWGRFWQ